MSEQQGVLATIARPRRLAVSLGGVVFFISYSLVLALRRLLLGLEYGVTVEEDMLIWLLRLLVDGALLAPLLHRLCHLALGGHRATLPLERYRTMLLAPLVLSVLMVPLLAIRPISADAAMIFAANAAMLMYDLLLVLMLRTFPKDALVVPDAKALVVRRA